MFFLLESNDVSGSVNTNGLDSIATEVLEVCVDVTPSVKHGRSTLVASMSPTSLPIERASLHHCCIVVFNASIVACGMLFTSRV